MVSMPYSCPQHSDSDLAGSDVDPEKPEREMND